MASTLACMHALHVHLHNYIGMKIEEEANEYWINLSIHIIKIRIRTNTLVHVPVELANVTRTAVLWA